MNTEERSTTPDHIKAAFNRIVSEGAIPKKSKKNYGAAYQKYVLWKGQNNITSNSECAIGCYIDSLVGSIVPTSLWVTLSMIRSHILVESTTALAESGADSLTIQRHGRWQSSTVAERYMSKSATHRVGVAQRICYDAGASTSSAQATKMKTQIVTGPNALADPSPEVSPFAIDFGKNNTFAGNITFICKK